MTKIVKCVRVCVRACVRACVCACACVRGACVRVGLLELTEKTGRLVSNGERYAKLHRDAKPASCGVFPQNSLLLPRSMDAYHLNIHLNISVDRITVGGWITHTHTRTHAHTRTRAHTITT